MTKTPKFEIDLNIPPGDYEVMPAAMIHDAKYLSVKYRLMSRDGGPGDWASVRFKADGFSLLHFMLLWFNQDGTAAYMLQECAKEV